MLVRFATAGACLGLLLCGGSCKKRPPQVQPTVGNITGTIYPAWAATRIRATDAARRTYAVAPVADGSFALRNLPNGDYQLTIDPTADYTEPVLARCTVRSATSNIDTVTMLPAVPTGRSGLLGFSTGELGVRFSSITATLMGQQLLLTATRTGADGLPDAEQILLQLTDFNGAGTYECGSTATIIYQSRSSAAGQPQRWSTASPESHGTVRITYHDPVARRLAGVFSFEAGASNSVTSGFYHTTNGYFADVTY